MFDGQEGLWIPSCGQLQEDAVCQHSARKDSAAPISPFMGDVFGTFAFLQRLLRAPPRGSPGAEALFALFFRPLTHRRAILSFFRLSLLVVCDSRRFTKKKKKETWLMRLANILLCSKPE